MRRRRNRRAAGSAALLLAILTASSCSGTSDADRTLQDQRGEQRPLSAEDRLVQRTLIKASEIEAEAPGSIRRAFLEYWSAVEHEAWAVAVEFLSPELRRALEPQHLVTALQAERDTGIPIRPTIRDVVNTRGVATVRYLVRTTDGTLRPTSMSWLLSDGRWYVRYAATLDTSYSAAVQQAVQNQIDPTTSKPSKAAVRAGAQALRAQAEVLAPPPGEPDGSSAAD